MELSAVPTETPPLKAKLEPDARLYTYEWPATRPVSPGVPS